MPDRTDQVLTVAQMRDAEAALIAAGTSVDELMQRAGRGAADWVWRIAAGRAVTLLCGPGNNGGDGYVIAEALRERGAEVRVIAALEPVTAAARTARALYQGEVTREPSELHGGVLVDCLFGSGLTRALEPRLADLIVQLARAHDQVIAIDLPSGIDSNTGQPLNPNLPANALTIALGAWKFAHFLMPARGLMAALRLVDIGVDKVPGAARAIGRPALHAPPADAHKYTRGLLGVVVGAMPGAALLAGLAAQGGGAGYVRLYADDPVAAPADLVVDGQPLAQALTDERIGAVLVGPGLGRSAAARERLGIALSEPIPAVLDADALVLLAPRLLAERSAPLIATPHEGELTALERAFGCDAGGSKVERAATLARASGMVIVAKGPDSVVAAPDGRLACAAAATPWLSTAGTGDVLAGAIASRLATRVEAFDAACQGLWLHAEAARLCPPAFTASQLAARIASAYATCL